MPHAGRFAIVTFLGTLGMPNDEIIKTFHTSPDFDNSMTTYQVQAHHRGWHGEALYATGMLHHADQRHLCRSR